MDMLYYAGIYYIALKTNIKHDFDGRIEGHNKRVFALLTHTINVFCLNKMKKKNSTVLEQF